MGCSSSSRITNAQYTKIMEQAQTYERQLIFDQIGLKDVDIEKIYKVFKKFDIDKSGKMDLDELIAVLGLEDTPFVKRVFKLFDSDGSNDIDFKEFVLSLWNYCTLTQKTLVQFMFKLFDLNNDGLLSLSDAQLMMREIYGVKATATDPKLLRMIKECQEKIYNSGGGIDIYQFAEFSRNYQLLFFPAFQVQTKMREKVLGSSYWAAHANYRLHEVDGKAIDLPMRTKSFLIFNSLSTPATPASKILRPTPAVIQTPPVVSASPRRLSTPSSTRRQSRQQFDSPIVTPRGYRTLRNDAVNFSPSYNISKSKDSHGFSDNLDTTISESLAAYNVGTLRSINMPPISTDLSQPRAALNPTPRSILKNSPTAHRARHISIENDRALHAILSTKRTDERSRIPGSPQSFEIPRLPLKVVIPDSARSSFTHTSRLTPFSPGTYRDDSPNAARRSSAMV